MPDPGMQPEQVLQQPNAGNAMNRRDLKGNAADLAVREIEQPLLNGRFIQIGPLLTFGLSTNTNARGLSQIIEVFQTMFSKQIVHDLAALAAEIISAPGKRKVFARLAAVITARRTAHSTRDFAGFLINNCVHTRLLNGNRSSY